MRIIADLFLFCRLFEELFGGGFGSGRSRVFSPFGGMPGSRMSIDPDFGDDVGGMPFFTMGGSG